MALEDVPVEHLDAQVTERSELLEGDGQVLAATSESIVAKDEVVFQAHHSSSFSGQPQKSARTSSKVSAPRENTRPDTDVRYRQKRRFR